MLRSLEGFWTHDLLILRWELQQFIRDGIINSNVGTQAQDKGKTSKAVEFWGCSGYHLPKWHLPCERLQMWLQYFRKKMDRVNYPPVSPTSIIGKMLESQINRTSTENDLWANSSMPTSLLELDLQVCGSYPSTSFLSYTLLYLHRPFPLVAPSMYP